MKITIAQLIVEKSEGNTTNVILLANNLADAYLPELQVWVFRDGSELSVEQVHNLQ